MRKNHMIAAIAAGLLVMMGAASDAAAQSVAAFYKGKNLNFIVPYKPGGGYDTYSRIIAPYLEKYTGARVVVRNMPGAGGLLGVNETYKASPNGLTMTVTTGL